MAGKVARRGGKVEALVLLVAAAERSGGEVPCQPEQSAALFGVGTDALQIFAPVLALLGRLWESTGMRLGRFPALQ